ncbi:MAG: NADH:ubiquinone reductase (Na(+)-transporting) subunit F [Candidatus Neomarinimicrobiota bacterium]
MITALIGVIFFTGLILLLVILLNIAGSKLLPQGEVEIKINDNNDKSFLVRPGSTLLNALTGSNIFLPSACGGQGTCAQCKCQILDGAGEILPTETGFIDRKEAADHWRLACQVKIKQELKIKIPDEIFNIKKYKCNVISNHNVATFIKELIIELPPNAKMDYRAGGYIQIAVPLYNLKYSDFIIEKEYHEDWDKYDLWRFKAANEEQVIRAYSMASYPAEGKKIMLNVRIASPPPWAPDVQPGIASSFIFNLKPGDSVEVSGPYGEFFTKDSDREMIFIGGGAGMAPMRSHLYDLLKTNKSNRKISFWYGARSLREMFYDHEFKELQKKFPNFSYQVGLSEPLEKDNWEGPIGFIHQILYDNKLKEHDDPTEIEYYMCGPPPMIDALDKMLYDLGVEPEMIAYDKFG